MIPGRTLNPAFLMLVIRFVYGRKVHFGTRRPGDEMTQSIIQSNLNVSFGMGKGHEKQRRTPGTKKKSKISFTLCKKFGDLDSAEQHNLILKMAHKMKVDSKDIIGEKCVKD